MKHNYYLKSILLCLCLFTGINASAADAYIGGIFYNFSGDEAAVTYQVYENYYPYFKSNYYGVIVIPESVTYNNKTYTVTSIGEGAFSRSTGLTSITIPNSVTCIDNYAFFGCSGLTSITIPNSVTSIGEFAFRGCSSLTSFTIPNTITSIERDTFAGCTGLTNISIPQSVTYIGEGAFIYCPNLTPIIIPESVTSIGDHTFNGCISLTSISIPEGVTSIGGFAFYDCAGLTSINIPNSVIDIGYSTFEGCTSIVSVTIPNSVKNISSYAFKDCTSLTLVTISNNVTNIQYGTFTGCSSLSSVSIPCGVTNIEGCLLGSIADDTGEHEYYNPGAFEGCTSLTYITIPESVISIGENAFAGCDDLTSVTLESDAFVSTTRNPDPCPMYSIFGNQVKTYIIGDAVKSIGMLAFRDCSIKSVTIGNSVTSIGQSAFSGCSALTSVTIPNSVTSIGLSAFSGCSSLSSVTIPNSVTSIDQSTFSDCRSLTSVTIPESVTSIGSWAFKECTGLTSITIPVSVTSIGSRAFYRCSNLTSFTIPANVTTIGKEAFYGCSSMNTVKVFIETPLSIDAYCFTNNDNTVLYVPYGSKTAYEAAFYWKRSFKEIREMPNPNAVTVGSSGFATFASPNDLDFSDITGIKAYIASGFSPSTGKLVLTNVTEVPTGEGLYIVGEPGTYEIATTETDMFYSNLLKGVTSATTIYPTDGSYTNFILANGSHGVAFYSLSEAGELAAGKAYLQLPTASVSNVKAISVIFDDDEDAVQNIEEDRQAQRIYNLQGQQVNAPKRGLYIINGKKVFIK